MTATAHPTADTAKHSASSTCVPSLPFCGLGDVQCLATRIAACRGMEFVELSPAAQPMAMGKPSRP